MDTNTATMSIVLQGGGTFAHGKGEITQYQHYSLTDSTGAWVVGVPVEAPYSNTVIDVPTGPELHEFVKGALWDFIRLHHDQTRYFGVWIEHNPPYSPFYAKVYIDHVMVTTFENAVDVGRQNGEKAIYNLITKETVAIDYSKAL